MELTEVLPHTPHFNRWYPSCGRYRHNIIYVFKTGEAARIRIDATQARRTERRNSHRTDPAHHKTADSESLHAFMGCILGNPDWYKSLPWHAAREEFEARRGAGTVVWPIWWELAGAVNHVAIATGQVAKKEP